MAVNDVYEIIVTGTLLGQDVVNTYFYEQQNAVIVIGITIAQALLNEFGGQVWPLITATQGSDYRGKTIRVNNLFDLSDSAENAVADVGSWAGGGNIDSAFTAVAYVLSVVGRSVRQGHKRIGGITEDVSTDGVITSSTYITAANALAAGLAAPITNGAIIPINTWYPCVVKRVRSGTKPDYKYRLPETLAEKVLQLIVDVTPNLILSSQVSRKIGRGA